MMLFGDGAIWYRFRHGDEGLLDLGEAWTEMTGLPFVFAAWAAQRGIEAKALAKLLRDAKAAGLEHIEEVVQNATEATPEFRREYLTKNVRYELGEKERQGMRRFQKYLSEMGLVGGCHDLRYVG
jgi:predicted solute-binding protein